MKSIHPLLVAIPTFALGGLVTTSLTGTARAQSEVERARDSALSLKEIQQAKARPMYRIVISESDMNKYAAQGYAVKEATGTANYVSYLMQRYQ